MDKLPEWWSSKEFEELDREHESELLRERVLRLETFYNAVADWVNRYENGQTEKIRQEALEVERQIQKRLDEQGGGDPAPK